MKKVLKGILPFMTVCAVSGFLVSGIAGQEVLTEAADQVQTQEDSSEAGRISAPVVLENGTVYFCEKEDGGYPLEELQQDSVLLKNTRSAIIEGNTKLLLKLSSSSSCEIECIQTNGAEEDVVVMAEDVSMNASFAYRNGAIYYFTAAGCLMTADMTSNQAECIFDPEDYGLSPDVYENGEWTIDIDEANEFLYFIPLYAEGKLYQLNFATGEVRTITFSDAPDRITHLEVDGDYAYMGSLSGIIYRYRLDGSADGDRLQYDFVSDQFAMYQGELYMIKDDRFIYRINSSSEEKLAQSECNSIICVDDERIVFRKIRMDGNGYEYYSCALDGTDERYHGYRS